MKDKDVIVNLLRTIEQQNKTIDKLSDKIIAQNDPSALHALRDEAPERTKPEEEPYQDADEVPAKEAIDADTN